MDETAAAAISSLLGETAGQTSADEIAWAFRKTLEQMAGERPLVVVFDKDGRTWDRTRDLSRVKRALSR